jgi:hypothetical protein
MSTLVVASGHGVCVTLRSAVSVRPQSSGCLLFASWLLRQQTTEEP